MLYPFHNQTLKAGGFQARVSLHRPSSGCPGGIGLLFSAPPAVVGPVTSPGLGDTPVSGEPASARGGAGATAQLFADSRYSLCTTKRAQNSCARSRGSLRQTRSNQGAVGGKRNNEVGFAIVAQLQSLFLSMYLPAGGLFRRATSPSPPRETCPSRRERECTRY